MPTYKPCPLPRSASNTLFGSSALAVAIATEPSNSPTVCLNALTKSAPAAFLRATTVGITFASVVIGSAILSPLRTLISAWLSTSPLSAETKYGIAASTSISSLLTGCAFASEIMPTLAHLVCPKTDNLAPGWLTNKRSSASPATACRIARVLSPSSPISAAALYTNDQALAPAPTRTEPDVNKLSSSRPLSRGLTRASLASSPCPHTSKLMPAESRPRTSIRSSAEKDC